MSDASKRLRDFWCTCDINKLSNDPVPCSPCKAANELERLERELAEVRKCNEIGERILRRQVDESRRVNAALVEALEFYADPGTYSGELAREILALAAPEEPKP